MKLYRVVCRGMKESYGIAYVISENSKKAYLKLKKWLDRYGYGEKWERELEFIELIAEDTKHPDCGAMLFLPDKGEQCHHLQQG